MKKRKNRLDEMQEQKMLHIEHNGYWIAYIGLAVAILAQIIYYGPDYSDKIGGEFFIFMVLSANTLIGCVRYSVWDRRFAPTWKVNICASLIAGVIGGVFHFFATYFKYHTWKGCAAAGVILGINIFVCTFALMSLVLAAFKFRERRLEKESEDDK